MADPVTVSTLVASWFTPSSLFVVLNLVIGTIVISSRFGTPKNPSDHQHHHHHHDDGQPRLIRRSSSLLERFRSLHFYKHEPAFPETEYLQPVPHSPQLVPDSPQLVRTPSLIERVRSFNFGFSNNVCEPTCADTVSAQPDDQPEQPTEPQLVRTPSLLERLKSMNLSSLYRSDSTKAAGEVVDDKCDVPQSKEDDHDAANMVKRSKSESSRSTPVKLTEKMKKSASENAASRWQQEEQADRRAPEPETARHGGGYETASFAEDETVDAKADDFINRFKQQLRLQRLNSFLRYKEMIRAN